MRPARVRDSLRAMGQGLTVHIVDPDGRSRTELARAVSALGHRAEAHAGWDALIAHAPREGIVLARDTDERGAGEVLAAVAEAGAWLPLILVAPAPATERVVEGMRQGASDFLALPCPPERLAAVLARVAQEAAKQAEARRRTLAARRAVAALSRRERDVLERLCEGRSNKDIARVLGISPRTVEIHRAKMMAKLGARHTADAVRVRLEARLDAPLARKIT